MKKHWLQIVVALALGFHVAGCGDDGEGGGAAAPTATRVNTATPTAVDTAAPTATATSPEPTSTATASPIAAEITVVEPVAGAVVSTFTFTVNVTLTPGAFEPGSLVATLNGAPLALSGGPRTFTATVEPGPPLQDENVLALSARTVGGSTVSSTSSFQYLPPKARARRITDAADLMQGPLAHGRIGDYLIANTVARFIVQDVAQRDLYSVGTFGGNLIDAELVGRPGIENFLEMQPAVNIETVINAQTAEIVNDGQDGTAAIVRTCGPDDVLDFVHPSTIIEDNGLRFPASADDVDYDVEGCTEYVLEPGKSHLRVVTTIMNNQDAPLGLFVGDFINGGGELEQWTTSGAGIGEILTNSLGVLSYIGYGEATGVDYSHVTLPIEGSPIPGSTFFTASGVSYILQSHSILQVILGSQPPTFVVPANGSNSFTRYFGVGDGSGANAVDIENEVKGIAHGTVRGCVTVDGTPAPAVRVALGPEFDGAIQSLVSQFVTDELGCYEGTVPPGTYSVAAARLGTPYEGGGLRPLTHPITVTAGGLTEQNIELPGTGRLHVTVTDQTGSPIPARVAVIGFDPSPEPILPIVIPGLGTVATGLFNDTKDPLPFGFVRAVYAGAGGVADFEVEPGQYQLFVSRGSEYSAFDTPVTITAGETTAVAAQIAHVVETDGFVSSDFHVHGINSADSRVNHTNRVMQFAGEGVDNIIITDHHAHTDLNPTIERLGLADFVHSTTSEEITTWDYGHFNAYPLTIDPVRPSGGSTDWAIAAPPGMDFKSLGAYSATPAEIAALATGGPQSTPDTVIQINHIDSHFSPLQIDTSVVPPRSFLSAEGKLRLRLDPNTGNLFHHFLALELWNGSNRAKQREFLVDRIGIWMNHLNQGLQTTAIGDTDTHDFLILGAAGARTWTAAADDAPRNVDDGQIARSVRDGKAVGGQGIYVQAELLGNSEGPARPVADLTLGGSTIVTSNDRSVDLAIRVQAPTWAPYDRIEIYANAETTVTRSNGGVPVLFSAVPTRVLIAGTDFTVERVNVFANVPGAERLETNVTVPFTELDGDTWFVVVVKGTDGVSRPMYPIFSDDLKRETNTTLADLLDGNLGEGGVPALGFTNALYADVDGVPGFQAPLAP